MATSISVPYGGSRRDTAHGARVRVLRPSRGGVFALLLAAYVLLTLGIIFRSPVLDVDQYFVDLHLMKRYPGAWHDIHTYVILGQRKPSIEVFLPFFVWVALRTRSIRPLVMLATALLLLNVSVGVAKLATGRLGPRGGHAVHDVFLGGNIYPSGHVSNAVVLYGLMAMIALRFRRLAVAAAVFISVTVALGTIYLNTHWFSDIVGGWFAGGLVLLVLPSIMTVLDRPLARATRWAGSRRERKYALTAVGAVFATMGLSWVYFGVDWDNLLAVYALAAMVVLCLPALVPMVVERWRRRREPPAAIAPPGGCDAPPVERIDDEVPVDEPVTTR